MSEASQTAQENHELWLQLHNDLSNRLDTICNRIIEQMRTSQQETMLMLKEQAATLADHDTRLKKFEQMKENAWLLAKAAGWALGVTVGSAGLLGLIGKIWPS